MAVRPAAPPAARHSWTATSSPVVAAAAVLILIAAGAGSPARAADGPWPADRARAWGEAHPWLAGCNFSPSTAINELEMWQADTFDLATIDRELGWAEGLGFNSVRVFLHNIPYDRDPQGFLGRIDAFLSAADRHKIGVVFVLLDACWDPFPVAGKQHAPVPGLHNSGWVQCPGLPILRDPVRHDELKGYVTGVIGRFRDDRRIHAWDLFNEPDNPNRSSYGRQEPPNKAELSLALLKKAFAWARAANPSQPLTAGAWVGDLTDPAKLSPINAFMLDQSDVISFHNYKPLPEMKRDVEALKRYGRPILCTEYMARPAGSRFDPILAYLKSQKVGAYNWGFVAGKTQTIYPWDSWQKPYPAEPPVWFHDILRSDGTPYDRKEVEYIRGVTGARKAG
ncbi:glycoside hydrolase 5 family protein [Aquisphaera giovannonii]|nr:cellulase family glycosylhydrolase [Aquisphaera giovannonii]